MESTGDEKRIRALFSELKAADREIAPSFTAVWHRAQSRSLQPQRAFNLSFVAATALLIFALASLAIWSKYSQPAAPASAFGNVPAGADFPTARIDKGAGVPATPLRLTDRVQSKRSRAARLAAQERALMLAATRKAASDAKEIASWQSPTASLLSSPSDDLFKSLPQLTENADELKSSLPSRPDDKEK